MLRQALDRDAKDDAAGTQRAADRRERVIPEPHTLTNLQLIV